MMQTKWGEAMEFDYIILDYFFSPAGWARTRWTEAFFKNTLPMLATSNILKPNGSIFLPNLDCVEELLTAYADILEEHFMWDRVKNPLQNPLYKSTERCQKELLLCPDMLTNATQVLPLNEYSDTPFIIFKRLNRSYEKRSASGTLIKRGAAVNYPQLTPPSSPGGSTDREASSPGSTDDQSEAGVPANKKRKLHREVLGLMESYLPGY